MTAMNLPQVIFGHTLDIVFSSEQLVYDLNFEDMSVSLLRWLDPFLVHLRLVAIPNSSRIEGPIKSWLAPGGGMDLSRSPQVLGSC